MVELTQKQMASLGGKARWAKMTPKQQREAMKKVRLAIKKKK